MFFNLAIHPKQICKGGGFIVISGILLAIRGENNFFVISKIPGFPSAHKQFTR